MFTGEKVSNFQERFSQLVDESGKSLLQLSKELHVSNQALSTWRTGIRSPKLPTIMSVADYFNVNVQWLMGYDVIKKANRHIIISNSDISYKKHPRTIVRGRFLMSKMQDFVTYSCQNPRLYVEFYVFLSCNLRR